MVAQQLAGFVMKDQGRIAAGTARDHSAITAEDVGCSASPIKKQDGLLTGVNNLAELLLQRAAE
jgi:transcriptional regulator of acetoin/glycerol metabolism